MQRKSELEAMKNIAVSAFIRTKNSCDGYVSKHWRPIHKPGLTVLWYRRLREVH